MNLSHGARVLLAPAVATLIALPLLASCGGTSHSVKSVPLATVVGQPQQWKGKRVDVQGTLLRFTDAGGSTYGVVQDAGQHRIGIKNLSAWQSLVGRRVDATGTVEFDASFGWFLAQPNLTAAAP
jgi:hypothetical protein